MAFGNAVGKAEAQETFNGFIAEMDDRLEWFISMASSFGYAFNFSPDEFEKLEEFFDEMKESAKDDLLPNLVISFARYLGEVVRRSYGGEWRLITGNKRDALYHTPVIIGHSPAEGLRFSPMITIKGYMGCRTRGAIRQAVDSHINPVFPDFSKITLEEE